MKVRFWGTRGSIPTPGPSTVRYGGNTACVEVRAAEGGLLVLDAGTGLRELGLQLVREGWRGAVEINLLLTHLHWDHIQGIPFFKPAFDRETRVHVRGPRQAAPIRDLLGMGMDDPFFPVDLDGLPASFEFEDLASGAELRIGGFVVRTTAVVHPQPTLAYRVDADGASVVYATDTEDPFSGRTNPVVALAAGADLLIHDAQYLAADYRKGWGHSTVDAAIGVAINAGVRVLALSHHDPDRNDDALDRIAVDAQALARAQGSSLEVLVAREGLELEVGGVPKPA